MNSQTNKKNVEFSLLQDADIDDVIRFYNFIYKEDRNREKFIWEFFTAPAGKAIYVVAKDSETMKIVGTQCAIPLELITSDGTIMLTGKSEDTLVHPDYRGLSIFEKMYDLLFEKCKENGMHYIWGFTTAKKPFLKLGFDIPYDQSQSVMALHIKTSYEYLSGLNPKNNFSSLLKIRALCVFSKLLSYKRFLKSEKFLDRKFTYTETGRTVLKTIEPQVLMAAHNGFSIKQDRPYLTWRIETNPFHDKIFNLYFISKSAIVANIIFNHYKNGVWYLINDIYAVELTQKQKKAMFRKSVKLLLKQEKNSVKLIRTWDFSHNEQGINGIELRKDAGLMHIDRGISFVWKCLNTKDSLKVNDFNLSRIATQGKI
jgi:GNAT superfamily N-acetyltransferase